MCDQRDQLIDYLYDDCQPEEQRRFEAHLQTCPECRTEAAELRSVRQDLLAWDVPEHGSVWTPFVPVRVTPWWREVPAWALAAAASLMFLLGVAGGFATRALMPVAAAAPASALQTTTDTVGNDHLSRTELTQLEQRLLEKLRADLEQQVQLASSRTNARTAGANARVLRVSSADEDRLVTQVGTLINESEDRQQKLMTLMHNNFLALYRKIDAKADSARTDVDMLRAAISQPGK